MHSFLAFFCPICAFKTAFCTLLVQYWCVEVKHSAVNWWLQSINCICPLKEWRLGLLLWNVMMFLWLLNEKTRASRAHKGCMRCTSWNARCKDKQKYFQKPICRFETLLAWSRRQRRLQWAVANLSTVDSRGYELQMCSIWLSNMLLNSYMRSAAQTEHSQLGVKKHWNINILHLSET